ncbi:MAG: protease inhibitor Kazal-type [Bacteroidota bacterium]|nr:protease inhibitor Kazal-type [Bacteroidota bacterium]
MRTMLFLLSFILALFSCGKEGSCPDPGMKRRNSFAICQDILQPVCGCEGRTYANECEARRNGVTVSYSGECDG